LNLKEKKRAKKVETQRGTEIEKEREKRRLCERGFFGCKRGRWIYSENENEEEMKWGPPFYV
jgi:hypothetical protein